MFVTLATAVLLGLSAAVPIGPVNIEIMRRGLAGGFWAAAVVGLGAVTVDGAYSIMFTLGFTTLADPTLSRWLGWAGAGVLVLIGALSLREAVRQSPIGPPARTLGACEPKEGEACPVDAALLEPEARPSLARGYLTGLTMTAVNPMTLAFWASIGAVVAQLDVSGVRGRVLFSSGVVAGASTWVFVFSAVLHHTRHLISDRARRLLTLAGGLGVIAFGILLGLKTG